MKHENEQLELHRGSLEVYTLGLLDFASYLKLQDRIVFDLSGRKDNQSILLLCEFAPSISIGRNSNPLQQLRSNDELRNINVETFHVARGGTTIPHLPGQLAVSLICPLQKCGFTAISFQHMLIDMTLEVLKEFKVETTYSNREGLFLKDHAVIGYSGTRVRFGVSSFGMFLNVNPWLEFFRLVQLPGGYHQVSSLNKVLMKHVESAKVREKYIQLTSAWLGYEKVHLYTRHHYLEKSTRKRVVHVPY